jgi:hypothetical protein
METLTTDEAILAGEDVLPFALIEPPSKLFSTLTLK